MSYAVGWISSNNLINLPNVLRRQVNQNLPILFSLTFMYHQWKIHQINLSIPEHFCSKRTCCLLDLNGNLPFIHRSCFLCFEWSPIGTNYWLRPFYSASCSTKWLVEKKIAGDSLFLKISIFIKKIRNISTIKSILSYHLKMGRTGK